MMDKFSDLEAFVNVINHGGFSAAADRLLVAKSAISRRVNQLEERLGTRLINRTTRKISLTDEGREFYRQASHILEQLAEAEQSVSDNQTRLHGTIRLAAPLSFGFNHLTGALAEFLKLHPDIELDINFDDQKIDLVKEGYDMTVRATDMPDSTLIARRISPIRMTTCASPEYFEQYPRPNHPNELAGHVGLDYSLVSRRNGWHYKDSNNEPLFAQPASRIRCNNGDSIINMAIAGLGIAHQPTFLSHRAITEGLLEVVLPEWEDHSLMLYAVYPPGKNQPRRVRVLTDFLIEYFGQEPPWDKSVSKHLII